MVARAHRAGLPGAGGARCARVSAASPPSVTSASGPVTASRSSTPCTCAPTGAAAGVGTLSGAGPVPARRGAGQAHHDRRGRCRRTPPRSASTSGWDSTQSGRLREVGYKFDRWLDLVFLQRRLSHPGKIGAHVRLHPARHPGPDPRQRRGLPAAAGGRRRAASTWFALWPLSSGLFHPWQLLTYAFLHGSVAHIFLNMFALYMFGGALESYWGGRRFVFFYLVCVLAAGLTQLAVQAGGGGGRTGAGCLGRRVRRAARLRLVLPEAAPDPAADPDPDARVAVRDAVRAGRSCSSGSPARSRMSRTSRTSAACSAGRCASSTGVHASASVPECRHREPHRPAARPAGIAQERAAEAAAAEDAPVRQRSPSCHRPATRAIRQRARAARSAGLAQKGAPRSISRCAREHILAPACWRFGKVQQPHRCAPFGVSPGRAQSPGASLTRRDAPVADR